MEVLLQELRLSVRSLLRTPAFAAIAIATLALGIGANTAIFSIIDATLLTRFSVREPDRVLRLYGQDLSRNIEQTNFSVPKFMALRAEQRVFESLGVANYGNAAVMGPEGAELIPGAHVSAGFFAALGATPLLGRDFLADEEEKSSVMLISERLWQQRFRGAPNVIGQSLTIDGANYTIIGVMPKLPGFWDGDIWLPDPFELPGLSREQLQRGISYLSVVARLKDGVTSEQAAQNLKLIEQNYRHNRPDAADSTWSINAVDFRENLVGPLRPQVLTLLGAVGFVLLLACSNVANLLLVRFAGRQREIAVRSALGAARGRIIFRFLIESLVVATAAGALGALLVSWVLPLLSRIASQNLPFPIALELNTPVLFASLLIALVSGLLAGVLPALHAAKADVAEVLRDGARGTTGSRAQNRSRRWLVAGQVGLSLVLLSGAALLVASFLQLQKQPLGFDPSRVFVANINLGGARYPNVTAQADLINRFVAELRQAPGVVAASATSAVPLGGNNSTAPYARADGDVPPLKDRPLAPFRSVTPGFFAALGIPVIAGRDFTDADTNDRPQVVVLSQSAAKKLFPDRDALGQRLLIGSGNGGIPAEIVGIVGDIRSETLASVPDVAMYRSTGQRVSPFFQLVVSVQGDAAAFAGTARATLRRIDPGLALNQPTTLETLILQSVGQQRLLASLIGGFAVLALVLAAVGIYSVVAYTVAQRTTEIGVRAALGASPGQIVRLTLRDGLKPVAWGLAAGLAVTLAGGRVLESQLYQVRAWDPVMLLGASAALAIIAALACWLPARRAARIDPVTALHQD